MENIVVYLRVSTEQQDYDRQLLDLQNWANGKFNIIKVFAEKISGRKDERPQLIMMKQYLLANDIKFVATWELSRLSRKKITLLQMFEWFRDNQIQLFLYKQNTYLLNNENNISADVDLMLTMLSYFAESEVTMLRERIKSKMSQLKSEGKFTGGQISFGYKVVDDKLVADEITAPIVVDLFNHYIKDGESITTTMKYCLLTYNINLTKSRLRNMFHKEYYRGVGAQRLISDELFFAVVDKCSKNQTKAKGQKRKQERLLNYLIKCPECGSNFASKTTTDMYCCSHSRQYGLYDYANLCEISTGISCNHLDSIVWRMLKYILFNDDKFFERLNVESKQSIEKMQVEIDNIKTNITSLKKKIAKENIKLDADAIDVDTYKRNVKELAVSIKDFESEIAARQEKINAIQANIDNQIDVSERYNYINSITEFTSIRKLILQYIEEINVWQCGSKRSERKIRIKFRGIEQSYYIYKNMTAKANDDETFSFYIHVDFSDFDFETYNIFQEVRYKLLNFISLMDSKSYKKEKRKAYATQWRAKNREKIAAYQREWLRLNKNSGNL